MQYSSCSLNAAFPGKGYVFFWELVIADTSERGAANAIRVAMPDRHPF